MPAIVLLRLVPVGIDEMVLAAVLQESPDAGRESPMSILPTFLRRIVESAKKSADQENILIYQGSCHCGKVAFEVEGDLESAVACNCSLCSQRGSLLWAVDADKLRLLDPQADMGAYTFNKHEIRHRFCHKCGVHTHAEGAGWTAVNIRCLTDLDLATIALLDFDGKSA